MRTTYSTTEIARLANAERELRRLRRLAAARSLTSAEVRLQSTYRRVTHELSGYAGLTA